MKTWTGEAVLKMVGELADNNYEQSDAEDAVEAIDELVDAQVTESDIERWWKPSPETIESKYGSTEVPGDGKEAKYSQIVDPPHMVANIDCSECRYGGNGEDEKRCPTGRNYKTPQRGCCNSGKLMKGLQFKKAEATR